MRPIILEISIDEEILAIYEEYVNSLYVVGKRISSVEEVMAYALEMTAKTLATRGEEQWPILIGEHVSQGLQPPMDALVTELEPIEA